MWGLFCNVQSNTFEYNKVQLNTFECINQQLRCRPRYTFALAIDATATVGCGSA